MRALLAVALLTLAGLAAAPPASAATVVGNPVVRIVNGVPDSQYPYRKVGSQLLLRADVPAGTQRVAYQVQDPVGSWTESTDAASEFEVTIDLAARGIGHDAELSVYAYAYTTLTGPQQDASAISAPGFVAVDLAHEVRLAAAASRPAIPVPVATYANPAPGQHISATDVVIDTATPPSDNACNWWTVNGVRLPGSGCAPATPTAGPGASFTSRQLTLLSPPEGIVTVEYQGSDTLGNQASERRSFIVDRTPPTLAIIFGPADGATIDQNRVGFGMATDTPPPAGRLYCAVDEPAIRQANSLLCRSSSGLSHSEGGLLEGPHSFIVLAVDLAGNATELRRFFTTSAPTDSSRDTAPGFPGFKIKSTAKVCTSRRSFRIRVKKIQRKYKARPVSATVYVNGKKVTTRRGKRITAVVNLRGLKKGTYRVVIRVKLSNGRRVTDVRKYRTCVPKSKSKKKTTKKK